MGRGLGMNARGLRRWAADLFVWLLLAASTCAAESAPSDADVAARLDHYMQQQVTSYQFSGVVLVTRDGKRLLSKGYGAANREWGIPNTLTTRFRLASLTKQFTATAILQLREKGRLTLQDSICKYFDPCPPNWKPVTLHHLLSQTSGIPGYTGKSEPRAGKLPPWTEAQIVENAADRPLEFAAGTRFKYSDWGYSLLGFVIEKASGKSYEEALREQIFEPLGMQDTGYDHPEIVMSQRAAGYRVDGKQLLNAQYTPMTGPYSAGGLYSTAEDLYKWDQALYSDKVLPAAARAQMFTPVLENYGYGWMIARPGDKVLPWMTPGHFELVHPGSINGFSSEILRFPDDRVTIIVLANLENVTVGPPLAGIVLEGKKVSTIR